MNKDIRLSVDFFDHPKTMKLKRRLGSEAVECLIRLWMFAAKERPAGNFAGMDSEDIELAARWPGQPLTFVEALVNIRWLDVTNDTYSLHDWAQNNSWAAHAEDRSDKARFYRMAKTHPAIYAELKERGVDSVNPTLYAQLTTVERQLTERLSPAPAPAPAPSPSPDPSPIEIKKEKPFVPPRPDEVGEYMVEIGYHGNPQQFCDHYQAKGWLIGKNRMKDWKAAVRTWRGKDNKPPGLFPLCPPDPLDAPNFAGVK